MTVAVKAVVAEVWQPTQLKSGKISEIIDAWRRMVQPTYAERHSVVPQLHSAYARNRFKSRQPNDPIYLAHYDLKLQRNTAKHARVWIRIPYMPRSPVWLPLRMSKHAEADLFSARLRDSKLVTGHDGRYWMHFTVTRDVTPIQPRAILAVDLGEKRLATTVLFDGKSFCEPRFYGRQARGIRRHYAWLRKRLGERKLLRVIKKVKNTEKRKINTLCHQISRAIVEQAKANNAIIAIGDLKGIRASGVGRGRRVNRILSSMPCHRLTRQIEYKAAWEGISLIRVNEGYTSKTCNRCGSTDTSRATQSIFECHACRLIYNADLNGARNIAKRFWAQSVRNGAPGSEPTTLPERNLSVDDEERSRVTQPTKT